jgi:hypothetical protein
MGVLRALGVGIGPEETLVPTIAEDNPDGYLEQAAFTALDDELLSALGGHTSDPPIAPAGWHAEERFSAERARAHELVNSTFAAGPWAWKDPRASLLLPFWRTVIPGLRVVICIRNPAEVAASMMRRHTHPPWEHWLRMWMRYTADALRDSAGAERLVVLYDDLLAAPGPEVQRLGAFALETVPDADRVHEATATVRPETRRNAISDAAMVDDPRTPPEIASAYLTASAAVRAAAPLEAVTASIVGLRAAFEEREGAEALLQRATSERDTLAAELRRMHAQHASVIGSRSWRLTEPLRSMAQRGRRRRHR